MEILIIAAIMLLFPAIFVIAQFNALVALRNHIRDAWANVDTELKRRYDLIPNLVATVQGAANFEKSTITEVTAARASVGQLKLDQGTAPKDAEQLKRFEQAQGALSSALSRLLVVAERYPELRATAGFRDLQAQLEGTENRIAVERRKFNEAVQTYNTAVKSFPNMLYAGAMGFQPRPFFQAAAGAESAPKVQFDFGTATNR